MSKDESSRVREEKPHSARVALLLAAAMFVLVVDTSLMNVSISQACPAHPRGVTTYRRFPTTLAELK